MHSIAYGTYKLPYDKTFKMVLNAIKCGIRTFDTAQLYKNQDKVGEAIHHAIKHLGYKRSDFFVTSKVHWKYIKNGKVLDACKQIYDEIGIGILDCIMLHNPVKQENKNIKAFEDLIKAKEMDYCKNTGLSNFRENQIRPILTNFSKDHIYMNQIEMSLVCQNKNLYKFCKENDIIVQAHSIFSNRGIDIVSIKKKYNKEFTELVIGWLKFNSINIVFGSTNIDHIKKNIKIKKIKIKEFDLNKINIAKLSY